MVATTGVTRWAWAVAAVVAAAFIGAGELLGMDQLWQAIDAAKMPEAARLLLFEQAASGLRSHMADWLRARGVDGRTVGTRRRCHGRPPPPSRRPGSGRTRTTTCDVPPATCTPGCRGPTRRWKS